MKIEKSKKSKYLLCTLKELSEYIVKKSYNFKVCNFAIPEETDFDTLEEVSINANGWYGVKKIKTGFDNPFIDLFSDYYGGGCGAYRCIEPTDPEGIQKEDVLSMLMETLRICEEADPQTMVIAEVKK